jgi:hypothetical protein
MPESHPMGGLGQTLNAVELPTTLSSIEHETLLDDTEAYPYTKKKPPF